MDDFVDYNPDIDTDYIDQLVTESKSLREALTQARVSHESAHSELTEAHKASIQTLNSEVAKKQTEIEQLHNQINDLQADQTKSEDDKQKQIAELRATINTSEAVINELRNQISEAEDSHKTATTNLQAELSERQAELLEAQHSLNQAKTEINNLISKIQQLELEKAHFEALAKTLKEQLDTETSRSQHADNDEIKSLRAELTDANTNLARTNVSLQQAQSRVNELETQSSDLQKKLTTTKIAHDNVVDRLTTNITSKSNIQTELESTKSEATATQNQLNQKLQTARDQLQTARDQLQSLEQERTSLQAQLTEAQTKSTSTEANLRSQLEELQQNHTTLQERLQQVEQEIQTREAVTLSTKGKGDEGGPDELSPPEALPNNATPEEKAKWKQEYDDWLKRLNEHSKDVITPNQIIQRFNAFKQYFSPIGQSLMEPSDKHVYDDKRLSDELLQASGVMEMIHEGMMKGSIPSQKHSEFYHAVTDVGHLVTSLLVAPENDDTKIIAKQIADTIQQLVKYSEDVLKVPQESTMFAQPSTQIEHTVKSYIAKQLADKEAHSKLKEQADTKDALEEARNEKINQDLVVPMAKGYELPAFVRKALLDKGFNENTNSPNGDYTIVVNTIKELRKLGTPQHSVSWTKESTDPLNYMKSAIATTSLSRTSEDWRGKSVSHAPIVIYNHLMQSLGDDTAIEKFFEDYRKALGLTTWDRRQTEDIKYRTLFVPILLAFNLTASSANTEWLADQFHKQNLKDIIPILKGMAKLKAMEGYQPPAPKQIDEESTPSPPKPRGIEKFAGFSRGDHGSAKVVTPPKDTGRGSKSEKKKEGGSKTSSTYGNQTKKSSATP